MSPVSCAVVSVSPTVTGVTPSASVTVPTGVTVPLTGGPSSGSVSTVTVSVPLPVGAVMPIAVAAAFWLTLSVAGVVTGPLALATTDSVATPATPGTYGDPGRSGGPGVTSFLMPAVAVMPAPLGSVTT